MAGEPRYETADELGQRLGHTDSVVCMDCGVFVMDVAAHTRFHSILSSHAWSLAVLKTSHVADHVHARYDVVKRIDSRKFDSWSADALAEVTASMDPTLGGKLHDVHGGPGEDCWCGYAGHEQGGPSDRHSDQTAGG